MAVIAASAATLPAASFKRASFRRALFRRAGAGGEDGGAADE
jgi:hypothetical protein